MPPVSDGFELLKGFCRFPVSGHFLPLLLFPDTFHIQRILLFSLFLDTFGLPVGELITVVVGKHNELSEGGHMLIEAMACCRAEKVERRAGMASQDLKKEKGVIQGELRRQLSVVNIRASMACLLDRLHQCGEGGRMRNRREEWRVREEERMRGERELHFANRLKGRSLFNLDGFCTNSKIMIMYNAPECVDIIKLCIVIFQKRFWDLFYQFVNSSRKTPYV